MMHLSRLVRLLAEPEGLTVIGDAEFSIEKTSYHSEKNN